MLGKFFWCQYQFCKLNWVVSEPISGGLFSVSIVSYWELFLPAPAPGSSARLTQQGLKKANRGKTSSAFKHECHPNIKHSGSNPILPFTVA